MKCPICDRWNNEDILFCTYCDQPLPLQPKQPAEKNIIIVRKHTWIPFTTRYYAYNGGWSKDKNEATRFANDPSLPDLPNDTSEYAYMYEYAKEK
jgi:hypothetical protein